MKIRKRTSRRMKGSEEDKNRWIRCKNCNFPIDTSKVSMGDGSGITITDSIKTDSVRLSGEPKQTMMSIEKINTAGTMMIDNTGGDTTQYLYTPRLATATSGCPFCGCRNLL